MKYIILLFLITGFSSIGQPGFHWQHPVPTGHTYFDVQMLNDSTIVAVGMQGTVIRSTDAGQSWSYYFANTLADLHDVHFVDELTGYATGNANFWSSVIAVKTTDGGLSWDTLSTGQFGDFFGVHFINADTGWIAGRDGAIYRTNDGGTSWVNQSIAITTRINEIYMFNADTGIIAGEGGLLRKTFDGGTTWNNLPSGTSNEIHALWFINPDTGWFSGAGEIIKRTNDGGNLWSTQYNTGGSSDITSIMFTDSVHGVAVSQPYIYNTDDGGLTWDDDNNFGHQPKAVAIHNSGNGIMAGVYGTLQTTTDSGLTWMSIAGQANYNDFNKIQFLDKFNGWCVGDYGQIRKTTDGVNWTTSNSAGSDYINLHFLNQTTGYIVGEAGTVVKTINGTSFTNVNTPGFSDLYGVFFLNPNLGWVSGLNGAVYKTTNGGTSWTQQNLPSFTYNADEIWFANPDTGYIGAWGSRIYKTVNGGNTWTELFVGGGINNILDMQFFNADTGWVSSSFAFMTKTTDGGLTWSTPHQFCFSPATAIHFFNENNGFAGGGTVNWNCKLFRTTDGGATWLNTDLPFGFGILGLHMVDTNSVYISGEYGNIIYYGDSIGPATSVQEYIYKETPVAVFPNPASNSFTLRSEESIMEISVFNSTGKPVYCRPLNAKQVLIKSNFPQGIYLMRLLLNDGSSVSEKIIIQH